MKFCNKKNIFIFVLILFSIINSSYVFAQEKTKIRVSYLSNKNFIYKDKDGSYKGFAVDCLNKIATYEDFEYEFIEASWDESLEMLKNKEIDLVFGSTHRKSRKEYFEYSSQAVGRVKIGLYTNKENNQIYYEDFETLNGKKIGYLKSSLNIESLDEYAKYKGFNYVKVEYQSLDELTKSLDNGEIDVILADDLYLVKDYKLIAFITTEPIYFISYKGNSIMNRLNSAINQILSNEYGFFYKTFEKYYKNSFNQQLRLTRDEVEYVNEKNKINIGHIAYRIPISYYDKNEDQLLGITEDIINLIGNKSGLNFISYPIYEKDNYVQDLKQGKYDLLVGAMAYEFQNNNEYFVTKPLYESPIVSISKRQIWANESYDDVNNLVVTELFYRLNDDIIDMYSDYNVIVKKTNNDCFDALLSGEADIMLQNLYITNYWMQNPRYENLFVTSTYNKKELNGIVALNDVDPRLKSILEKTICTITDEEIDRLINLNTIIKPYKVTYKDVLSKYHITFSIGAILIILCIILMIIIILNKLINLKNLKNKNIQLAEAVEQAERANKVKSVFLSRMSHDMRTPLNAIMGFTEITKQSLDNKEKSKIYLDKITLSSKVLLSLINDILDMSAIENEKLSVNNSKFHLKNLLLTIYSLYHTQCEQKGIKFDIVIQDVTEETLIGDQLRVNQILLNLISNAYKFTDSGGKIKLVISQISKDKDKVYIKFEVYDTGCGMDEDMLDRIYKPFEQESYITYQKYGGSGLGLSITKNLVEIMHGAISVESQKGVGTKFKVELPFGLENIHDAEQAYLTLDLNVLIVCSDYDNIDSIIEPIKRAGLRFDIVQDGKNALKLISRCVDKYDLCIIDNDILDYNGIELAKKFKTICNNTQLKIVLIAYFLDGDKQILSIDDVDIYISKPIFQSEIFDIINQLSQKQSASKKNVMNNDDKTYDFKGKKILLADDNSINREIVIDILSFVNLQVDYAIDGEEVIEKFNNSDSGTYEAILMDIQMPKLNGYEATKKIRELNHNQARSIPIYAMTANAFTEDIVLAYSSGMNGHISKPIDKNLLYSILEKVIYKN